MWHGPMILFQNPETISKFSGYLYSPFQFLFWTVKGSFYLRFPFMSLSRKKTFGKINNNVLTELLIKAIKERREKTRTLTCILLHEMHGSCTVWKLHNFTLMLFFTKVKWNHPFWKLKFTANWFHEIIL